MTRLLLLRLDEEITVVDCNRALSSFHITTVHTYTRSITKLIHSTPAGMLLRGDAKQHSIYAL